jgi:hypothetical protein
VLAVQTWAANREILRRMLGPGRRRVLAIVVSGLALCAFLAYYVLWLVTIPQPVASTAGATGCRLASADERPYRVVPTSQVTLLTGAPDVLLWSNGGNSRDGGYGAGCTRRQ